MERVAAQQQRCGEITTKKTCVYVCFVLRVSSVICGELRIFFVFHTCAKPLVNIVTNLHSSQSKTHSLLNPKPSQHLVCINRTLPLYLALCICIHTGRVRTAPSSILCGQGVPKVVNNTVKTLQQLQLRGVRVVHEHCLSSGAYPI